MFDFKRVSHWIAWIAIVLVAGGGLALGVRQLNKRPRMTAAMIAEQTPEQKKENPDPEMEDTDPDKDPPDAKIPVKVVHPKKGLLERLTTQPGSIQSYEAVRLFAKVPGFLKWQKVDIGDKVKRGQVLAVVDVPELVTQKRRADSGVKQSRARVATMVARVKSAKADLIAAKAAVTQTEAAAKSAAAWVRFRGLQFHRMEALFAGRNIEEKLVDENKERYEASIETELSAKEAITTSKAKVQASEARIEQAEADVAEAEAEVEVAQAEVEKAQVMIAFATLTAPFDGVVTRRSFYEGDYIRSANEGANEPLLTVERTDLMRVIVQIPDRDVPFADPGDTAYIQIDALPGRKLPAKISRIASQEDPQTRLMRVEIDLPNPTGKICNGMYGQVTIVLEQERDKISVPSFCVTGKRDEGRGLVYVVRDGIAHQVSVRLGSDNGLRVAILEGLAREDEVVLNPSNSLTEGSEVAPTLVD